MPSASVTILKARVSLCKTFRNDTKEPYPLVKDFTSSTQTFSTLEQFTAIIKAASLEGACLLKGELDRELVWEPRAGHTDANKNTLWACLDLDFLPSVASIEDLLQKINVTDTSYILQWSASYGIHGNFALRAHLFFMLDKPYSPTVLKAWLKQLNLQIFPNDLVLTRAGVALKWGLDVSVCQSDKLIYVAPPICHPSSINEFQGERITLVKKANAFLKLPDTLLSVEQIHSLERTKIEELRKAAGMAPRGPKGFVFKDFKGEEYFSKPDQARYSDVTEKRGFVYMNLNGGDSLAYYHPIDDDTFIRNFKGEPLYRTKELIPEYWYARQRAKLEAQESANKGKLFLAFRDLHTTHYYNGTYDETTDTLDLHPARSEKQINDFLLNHGQPVPEAIPIWSRIFDPHAGVINLTEKTVNLFKPSQYMIEALTRPDHKPFPNIDRLCRHVVGEGCITHWYNWLAFLYQKRIAPGTAWVWHGVPGIGKGLLFSKVLTPLLGPDNVVPTRMEELEEKFNKRLEDHLLVFVDEAQVSDSGRSKMIMANLKNQITEPLITIRIMRTDTYTVVNRLGWIFASNMPDAVVIATNDRRFNVGDFQGKPIEDTDALVEGIKSELLDFAVFLRLYAVDAKAARTPIKNAAREQMILVSRPSADVVAQAILDGQLHQIWDALPAGELSSGMSHGEQEAYYEFKTLLFRIIKTDQDRLTREELHVIFNFCVGNVPRQPWKLTAYLKHHGVEIRPIRVGPSTPRGIMVTWQDGKAWFDARRAEIHAIEQPQLKVVPKKEAK